MAKNFDVTIAKMYKVQNYFVDFNNIESESIDDLTSFGFYEIYHCCFKNKSDLNMASTHLEDSDLFSQTNA